MSVSNNDKIKESRCFGFAFDKDAKECKICEVAHMCEQRVLSDIKKPTPKPTVKKDMAEQDASTVMKPQNNRPEPQKESAKPTKKKEKKVTKNYDPDMPDFKAMSIEELDSLAVERGLNPDDFNTYANVSIRRMRLTMAVKKTYEV
jgi:hypothetical protein